MFQSYDPTPGGILTLAFHVKADPSTISVESSSSLRLHLRVIRQALEFYVDLFPPYLSLRPRVIRQALEFYVDLFPPYLSPRPSLRVRF